MRPTDKFPLMHNFTQTGDSVDDIDYGVFTEGKEAEFKKLYQHLKEIQIDYKIYV